MSTDKKIQAAYIRLYTAIKGGSTLGKYYDCAKISSTICGINPDWIYAQWSHETNNFTSDLCIEYSNLGGLTQVEENDIPQNDGDFYYMKFGSPEQYAIYFGNYLIYYAEDGIFEAKTLYDYCVSLKKGGYYGDTLENYYNGVQAAYDELQRGGLIE